MSIEKFLRNATKSEVWFKGTRFSARIHGPVAICGELIDSKRELTKTNSRFRGLSPSNNRQQKQHFFKVLRCYRLTINIIMEALPESFVV